MTTCRISQFRFSFYRNRSVQCDFSGGQITGDAGLLPLRAFDERHHLTRHWAALFDDPRQEERVQHDALALVQEVSGVTAVTKPRILGHRSLAGPSLKGQEGGAHANG